MPRKKPEHLHLAPAPEETVGDPGEDQEPEQPVVYDRISEAIEGSARDVLASMRKALARKLDAGDIASNAISSTYKTLRELDREIRALDAEAEEEAKKRAAADNSGRRSFNASAI